MKAFISVVVCAVLMFATAGKAASVNVDELKSGGFYVLLAHTEAVGDESSSYVDDDCTTQRRLSASGEATAKQIGAWYATNAIPVGDVWASPMCRSLDTALLAFGRYTVNPALTGHFYRQDARFWETKVVAAGLSRPVVGNVILVTQPYNIQELLGSDAEKIREGDQVIVKPLGNGFEVVRVVHVSDIVH